MINLQELVDDFKKLILEEKRKKVLLILSNFIKLPIFEELYNKVLDTSIYIGEEILIDIYGEVMKFGESLKNKSKNQEVLKLKKISRYLDILHEKERNEILKSNVENLLSDI